MRARVQQGPLLTSSRYSLKMQKTAQPPQPHLSSKAGAARGNARDAAELAASSPGPELFASQTHPARLPSFPGLGP